MSYRFAAVLLLLLLVPVTAAWADDAQVQSVREAGLLVELLEKPAKSFDLRITPLGIKSTAPTLARAKVFVVEDPARLVIDINGWRKPSQRKVAIKHELIKALRFGSHRDKLRIVVDLSSSELPHFAEKYSAGEILLTFETKQTALPLEDQPVLEPEVRENIALPEIEAQVAIAEVTAKSKEASKPSPAEWREATQDNTDAWVPIDGSATLQETRVSSLFSLSVGLLVTTLFVLASLRYRREAGRAPHAVEHLALVEAGLINCYEILGCSEKQSDKEIKARYKELAKKFHSDKLASQELPEEIMELSAGQFRKIRDAYDAIRDARGF